MVVFLLTVLVAPCSFTLTFPRRNDAETVSDCVRMLLRRHISENQALVTLGSDDIDGERFKDFTGAVFRKIHEESRYQMQTRGPRVDTPSSHTGSRVPGVKARGYVLLPQRNLSRSLTKYLKSSNPIRTWNPRALWIVILRHRDEAFVASRLLARSAAMSVVLLVPRKRRRVDVFTWTPRVDPGARCFREVSKAPVFLDTWLGLEGRFKFNNSAIGLSRFPPAEGCYVMTSVTHSPPYVFVSSRFPIVEGGIEIELYTTLARYLNFSVRYADLSKTRNLPKLMDIHLVRGITDVAFSGISYYQPLLNFIESTVPYLVDRYVMYIPGGLPNAPWLSLVTEFRPMVWASVMVGCVIASLLLKRRFLVVWGLLLENPPPRLPVLKRFLVLYMLHCFVAQTSYKSSLIDNLINPGFHQPFGSLREVFRSDLNLCTDAVSIHLAIMREMKAERGRKIFKSKSINSCLNQTIFQRDTATAGSQNYVLYARSKHMRRLRQVRLLASDPITTPLEDGGVLATESISMVTVYGHPLLERFNSYIGRLLQAGFISKWWLDVVYPLPTVKEHKTKKVLSVAHLKAVFLALGFGYTVSFFVFSYELLSYYYKHYRDFNVWFVRNRRSKVIKMT